MHITRRDGSHGLAHVTSRAPGYCSRPAEDARTHVMPCLHRGLPKRQVPTHVLETLIPRNSDPDTRSRLLWYYNLPACVPKGAVCAQEPPTPPPSSGARGYAGALEQKSIKLFTFINPHLAIPCFSLQLAIARDVSDPPAWRSSHASTDHSATGDASCDGYLCLLLQTAEKIAQSPSRLCERVHSYSVFYMLYCCCM